MKNRILLVTLVLPALLAFDSQHSTACAQGTAFTYQGRLNSGSNPVAGSYDLTFALYSTSSGAGQVGSPVTNLATAVSNGLFTVTLDFGNQFPGADRWLEIGVRTNGLSSFTTLSPRQKLTPTPYAIFAENVGVGGLAAGTYGNAVTLNNVANSFSGNGGGLANVNALTLGGIGAAGFWQTTGNAGTIAGPNFLGTADNQPLEIHVNGVRALRIEPTAAPSLVAGYFQNSANGFAAATIAGGGTSGSPNYIFGNYGFVGAGHGGQAGSFSAVVDGGYNVAPGQFSFIGSGLRITNLADFSFIGTGTNNYIAPTAPYSFIGGGTLNSNLSDSAVIVGGARNLAAGGGAFIGGGGNNFSGNFNTVVSGGANNRATANAATISGGSENTAGGDHSTVDGGQGNSAAGDLSFAAGFQAKANHYGSFVWADGEGLDFTSTADNQFSVRAENGLRVSDGNSGNIVIQPLNDGNTGYQAINFNGYYDFFNGEQQFNTNKTRWRLVVDQRGATDLMTIDNFNGNTVANLIVIRTNGNVGIGITTPTNKLHVLGGATFTSGAGGANQSVVWIPGSASWSFTSDRNTKDRVQPVDAQSVLEKVSRLPIAEWSYIGYDQRHIGPMAQDFHEQFPLNSSDKSLNDADLHGVALAAIQGLNEKVETRIQKLDAENADLKRHNELLEKRLEALEKIIRDQHSN